MPWNRADYPANWCDEIRPAIFARAQGHCEGSPAYPGCRVKNYSLHPVTGSKVILTTAHLCRCKPKCGALSHLRLLCQRCHRTLDAELHAEHAAETKRRQREAQGQRRLFGLANDNLWRESRPSLREDASLCPCVSGCPVAPRERNLACPVSIK